MLEIRSPLAAARAYKSTRLKMEEAPGFTLTQAQGLSKDFEKRLAAIAGKLPKTVGTAVEQQGRSVMRTGPSSFWFVGPAADRLHDEIAGFCASTPLSHSRCRILLEGSPARRVLAKSIPLDFDEVSFKPGMFAMTGIHHTPVLVHCVSADSFHVYAMRTFAMSVWDWLADAALEFAD